MVLLGHINVMKTIERKARNLKVFYWKMFGYPGVSLAKDLINHFCHYHKFTFGKYKGRCIGNVPRGMLSHWCRIKNGVIENWQAVVPSTWNASPKDAKGQMGSYEACLIGLKIADLKQPLEIIRKIHSYDPCIACAVHVMDTKGNELSSYKVNPNLI